MRLSALTLALAAAAPVVASNCKPIVPVDPRQCGTTVIGRDAEFTVNADKWNIQTDALSSYTFGTCNPYAQNACISYDFPVTEQTDATGSLSFSYTMSTPALARGYRFFFYYRRTQEDAVDGTITCSFDGTQTQYDDSLVYQTANLWSLFAANFNPTGSTTTISCSLTLSAPVSYDLSNFGYLYYCDMPSQQR